MALTASGGNWLAARAEREVARVGCLIIAFGFVRLGDETATADGYRVAGVYHAAGSARSRDVAWSDVARTTVKRTRPHVLPGHGRAPPASCAGGKLIRVWVGDLGTMEMDSWEAQAALDR
jgi:hypothetical protein